MDSRHPTYVKTPKGIEEVERKAHGLPLKARQVLIMLDGKRDLAALQQMFPPDSVPGLLAELLAGGFARELEAPRQPVVATGDDEDPFVLAQTYMINIARKILGIAGKEVIARLQAAADRDALRALYPEWRAALRQSPDGVMRMKEFDYKLSQVLGDLSAPPAARAATPGHGPGAASPAAPRAGSAPANDDERLVMARNFMIGSLRAFLGIAANALIARVEAARTIPELRQMFFDWREALKQSPDAKRRLVELEAKLAALLS